MKSDLLTKFDEWLSHRRHDPNDHELIHKLKAAFLAGAIATDEVCRDIVVEQVSQLHKAAK